MQSPATSLTQAILNGDDKLVTAFLRAGSDVNTTSASGQTPLILAIVSGHTHLVPALLEAGADAGMRDSVGLNAFDWAERKGLPEVKAVLLRKANRIHQSEEIKKPVRTKGRDLRMTPTTSSQNVSTTTPDADPSDEKARKWIAGLRARFEEKARLQDAQLIEPETDSTIEPTEIPLPTHDQSIDATPPDVVHDKKNTRKRCPKCNAIYDDELLGYCAHHIVPLIDADAIVVTEQPKEMTPVIWLVLMISASAAIVVGYYLVVSRSNSVNTVPTVTASPTQPTKFQKAAPVLSTELIGKATLLPEAECPLKANGDRPVGTVVVRVKVDKEGKVYWTRSTGGDWLLRAAAMEAASKATFSSERLKGDGTEGSLTYVFKP